MTSLNPNNGAALLKKMYSPKKLESMVYKNRPFLRLVPKGPWRGKTFEQPVIHGRGGGVGADMASAITSASPLGSDVFSVPMREHFGVASVKGNIIEQSKTQEGAFVQALKASVDAKVAGVSNKLASLLYRTNGGALGQVGSVNATSIVLKSIPDVHNFEKGMSISADTVDGGGTVHSGYEPITGIDRNTGTLTAAAWTDISGIAADDYLFEYGDYDGGLDGLKSVLSSDSSPAALHGVTRTTDRVRLAGNYISSSDVSGTIEEKLLFAMERVFEEGGQVTDIFMHPRDKRDLIIQLGNRAVFDSDTARIGFKQLVVHGMGEMPAKIHADPFCPYKTAWCLQLDTWMLRSTSNGLPKIKDLDSYALRESDDDAYQVRVGFYGNLVCSAPGWNARVDLSE